MKNKKTSRALKAVIVFVVVIATIGAFALVAYKFEPNAKPGESEDISDLVRVIINCGAMLRTSLGIKLVLLIGGAAGALTYCMSKDGSHPTGN